MSEPKKPSDAVSFVVGVLAIVAVGAAVTQLRPPARAQETAAAESAPAEPAPDVCVGWRSASPEARQAGTLENLRRLGMPCGAAAAARIVNETDSLCAPTGELTRPEYAAMLASRADDLCR